MLFLKKYNIKSKNIPLMFLIDFLGGLLFFLPVLALYFEKDLFSVQNVAIIFAVEALSIAFFEIPTGALADIFGRKKIIVIDFAIALFALVFLLVGGSLLMFILYAIFNGLARALSSGNGGAMIYDSLAEEGKEKYYKKTIGTFYAIWPLGASFGSIIGGYLAHISLQSTVLYTFIPMGLAFVLTWFLKEPKFEKTEDKNLFRHSGASIKFILKNKQLLILVVGGFIMMSLGESVHMLDSLYFKFKEIPIIYFGYIGAVTFGLSSLGHYLGNSVSNWFGNKKTLVLIVFLSPLLTISSTLSLTYLAVFLFIFPSLFFGIKNVVYDYLFNLEIPSSHRATIGSINSLMSQIFMAAASPFVGYLADLYTINTAFRISGIILLVVPVLFLFIKDNK